MHTEDEAAKVPPEAWFMIPGWLSSGNCVVYGLDLAAGAKSHEGSGARNFDAPSESDLAFAAMEAATQRLVNAVKGETVAAAMTAMHAQRRSDGQIAFASH